jgi:hypothetical protein
MDFFRFQNLSEQNKNDKINYPSEKRYCAATICFLCESMQCLQTTPVSSGVRGSLLIEIKREVMRLDVAN